ncbi:AAA family ATPase [Coleofasciculus sp. G2-EDA-02]|uniref:AAA family ATPase n=1 Tax=Coleofasciculus sp. G2-EDA-02 TaxID=3069529 RepID=UPI004062AB0C
MESGNFIATIGSDPYYTVDECIEKARNRLEETFAIPLKKEDRIGACHKRLIAAIEQIELTEEDPSLKYLKLKECARNFKLSVKEIDEIWIKYLVHRDGTGELKTFQQVIAETDDYTKWLIQGLIRSVGLTVLHAKGGGGKTTIAYDWLYSLLRGVPWEGFPVTAPCRRVLIIQTDENKSDMIPTLIARGYSDELEVRFVDKWNIQNSAAFDRYLKEFDPDVVLIDSLFSVSAGSLVTENDAEYARPLLVINKIAEDRKKHVILIHHSNSEGGLRGTGAITASATAVMGLAPDPDHPGPDSPWRILTIEKFRGRCLARYSLEFFAENRRFICHGEHKKQDESSSLKDRIVSFLSAHRNIRYEIDELMEYCGGARASVRRAAGQLSAAGIISSCRKSLQDRRMVYFLEWEGDDNGGGDWDGDGIDAPSDPSPEDRITSGSFDDHSNGSFLEPAPPENYSDLGTAKDPVITENPNFQLSEVTEENAEGAIAQEETEPETQAQQEEQLSDTSDHSKDPPLITPRSTTDPDVITKDQLANCRGLSIQQPFATLIARGEKRFETRGQKTNYRGLILIHAPQKIDKHSFNRICREQDDPAEFPTSRVLAVAELTDCIFMDESFINEQPDQELLHGCWEPGRYAWKLENIRPLKQTVTGVGALGLWKPSDLLRDRLIDVELCDRADDPNDERWVCVEKCVSQIKKHPELRNQIPTFYSSLSDRQREELFRRLPPLKRGEVTVDEVPGVEPVTDEALETEPVTDTNNEVPGVEPSDLKPGVRLVRFFEDDHNDPWRYGTVVEAPSDLHLGQFRIQYDKFEDSFLVSLDHLAKFRFAPSDLFDKIQVGDRLLRNGAEWTCTKKSLSPKEIQVSKNGDTRTLKPSEVEALNFKIKALKPGLRIKLQHWYGRLSSRLKNGKWYVDWEGYPNQGLWKKYGEPPKSAIAPQDLEVVDES